MRRGAALNSDLGLHRWLIANFQVTATVLMRGPRSEVQQLNSEIKTLRQQQEQLKQQLGAAQEDLLTVQQESSDRRNASDTKPTVHTTSATLLVRGARTGSNMALKPDVTDTAFSCCACGRSTRCSARMLAGFAENLRNTVRLLYTNYMPLLAEISWLGPSGIDVLSSSPLVS